ncbi:MAG: hypothetical protein ABIZ34_09810 [Candidatus Limnocylindrales bacterium]
MSPLRRRYRGTPLGRPELQDDPALEGARSKEACPICGAHSLTLLRFPNVSTMGIQPYLEIIGMGEPTVEERPGIGCLTCNAEWDNLAAFRAGAEARRAS